jgi:hypothetical protein
MRAVADLIISGHVVLVAAFALAPLLLRCVTAAWIVRRVLASVKPGDSVSALRATSGLLRSLFRVR